MFSKRIAAGFAGVIVALLSASAWAAPTFVNGNSGAGTTSATTIAASAINATAGNTIIAFVSNYLTGSVDVNSVTDTAGNTYTRLGGGGGDANHTFDAWIAYAINGNASNVVTANFASSTTFRYIVVAQYSDLPSGKFIALSPVNVSASGTTHASGTVSTGGADDALLIGGFVAWDSAQTLASSGGTTLRVSGGGGVIALGDRAVTPAGTYSTQLSSSPVSTRYAGISAAFDATVGGGSSNAPRAIHYHRQMRQLH